MFKGFNREIFLCIVFYLLSRSEIIDTSVTGYWCFRIKTVSETPKPIFMGIVGSGVSFDIEPS